MKQMLALLSVLSSFICLINAQSVPIRCPMCPPTMGCFMGRCAPLPMRLPIGPPRPIFRPVAPIIPVRPIVRPMVPMGPVRPIVLPGAPVVTPPIINTPPPPIAGPMGGPLVPGPIDPLSMGGCAPGFRFINGQCVRSGTIAIKAVNAVNIGILILLLF